jgi:hypothetical protein
MARTIPEIRVRLYELAKEHGIPELTQLADETRRRWHGRKAPVRAFGITDEVRANVRAHAAAYPKKPMREIARVFGIDQGRVSEILFGKRGEE